MKLFLNNLYVILIIVLLTECKESEFSDRNIERKALKITELLDSNSIQTFHTWNYGMRGKNDIWMKVDGDSVLYRCFFRKEKDTTSLTIFGSPGFFIDFPSTIQFDTTKYWEFNIDMHSGNIFRVVSVDQHGQDHKVDTFISVDKVFLRNPFLHFSSLSALKDRLGVYGISYRSDIGNFVTFWLSAQHKLTYLHDPLDLDPKFQQPWLDDFGKGKTIKKHWNLRKLDKPRDAG